MAWSRTKKSMDWTVDNLSQHIGKMSVNKDKVEKKNLSRAAGAELVYTLVFRLADKIWGKKKNKEEVILSVSYSSGMYIYQVPCFSLSHG